MLSHAKRWWGGGGISDIERARMTVVRAFMGFGSGSVSGQKTGFRACNRGSGTNCARDWKNYPDKLVAIIERLQGVVIENRDAIEVMRQQDSESAFHYLDPPYLHRTRSREVINGKHVYKFEMTDAEHEAMITQVLKLKGMVIISGYENDLYNDMLHGWRTETKSALADGARNRIEKLWISPNINTQKIF